MNKIIQLAISSSEDPKEYSKDIYDQFKASKATVFEVANAIEAAISETRLCLQKLRLVRHDVSTHMGEPTETFDPERHTHKGANW